MHSTKSKINLIKGKLPSLKFANNMDLILFQELSINKGALLLIQNNKKDKEHVIN